VRMTSFNRPPELLSVCRPRLTHPAKRGGMVAAAARAAQEQLATIWES
jgi:hypothetical protein